MTKEEKINKVIETINKFSKFVDKEKLNKYDAINFLTDDILEACSVALNFKATEISEKKYILSMALKIFGGVELRNKKGGFHYLEIIKEKRGTYSLAIDGKAVKQGDIVKKVTDLFISNLVVFSGFISLEDKNNVIDISEVAKNGFSYYVNYYKSLGLISSRMK